MSNWVIMHSDELTHHGILGQKWGVRNGPPYPLKELETNSSVNVHGSYKKDDVVFISGKVKFDVAVPDTVRKEIDRVMNSGAKILIGDAPGADTRVQEYLSRQKYKNVSVYTTDDTVRNNIGGWDVIKISGNGETDERSIRRQKDIAMTVASTKGIAISSDDDRPESATSLNVQRLLDSGKTVEFFDYKKNVIYPAKVRYGRR